MRSSFLKYPSALHGSDSGSIRFSLVRTCLRCDFLPLLPVVSSFFDNSSVSFSPAFGPTGEPRSGLVPSILITYDPDV